RIPIPPEPDRQVELHPFERPTALKGTNPLFSTNKGDGTGGGVSSRRDDRGTNRNSARHKPPAGSNRRDSSQGSRNTDTDMDIRIPPARRFQCRLRHQLEMVSKQTQIRRQPPRSKKVFSNSFFTLHHI